ncbi:sterol-binding-like protein [Cutaneotrichosporon oleaginosum]|uniref:Sterol-binding-like protein n=1 Tax=Cutaneotrichosporon oleaginosum TaxID=879819 RepID=A0A0J0XD01_9TREE|nr:sterol-binding-like protein [Cutaneotrichosporon oleaginosum]KLT38940.1 sterol-binding-like protein [Cutaneotrichosporon oleaginosum]TXT07589.1 hypothetical protein COLE_04513 [Cutaneotrichosporon oleaginosum]
MSDLKETGFKSGDIFAAVAKAFSSLDDAEKQKQIKKTNGIFQINVETKDKKSQTWVIDLKQDGTVTKGAGKKPDVTVNLGDDTFVALADGKLNAQKAFMTGQLKVKGNIMLATKLDGVLKASKGKL